MEANRTSEQTNDVNCNQEKDLNNGASTSNEQNDHQTKKKRAKKCRGNRKLQRYRRKLRQQGMNSEAIAKQINSFVPTTITTTTQSKDDKVTQEQTEKITATSFNEDDTTIFHLAKANQMKKESIFIKRKDSTSSVSVSNKKVKTPPVIKDSFDYVSVPDEVFFQMSSTVFNGIPEIEDLLNDDEKIKLIRHYTSLIDRISYVKLQEFQWKYYYQIGMTQNIWKGHISKRSAEKYSISNTYGRSKSLIEQRLKQIEQHLEKAQNAIDQFENEFAYKYDENLVYCLKVKELYTILYRFVQEKQQPLQHEYKYKREILLLDATDHQLLQRFFDVKPNKSQVTRTFCYNYRNIMFLH